MTQEEMLAIQNGVNSSTKDIFIRDLQIVSKSSIASLKEGEDAKRKTYKALCVLSKKFTLDFVKEKLEPIKDLELAQLTPIRVLHRRPDAERKRTVYFMKVLPVGGKAAGADYADKDHHLFLLKLATRAGTYVKEFVHGDFGRSEPNVAQILGCDVDIIALDVEVIKFSGFLLLLLLFCH